MPARRPIDPGCIDALYHLVPLLCRYCMWDKVEDAKAKLEAVIEAGRQPIQQLLAREKARSVDSHGRPLYR